MVKTGRGWKCLYIRPVVEYGCVAWPKLPAHLRDRLERFQRRAFKVILRKPLFEHCDHDAILLAIQQLSLESRRQYQAALLGFQLAHETAPKHLLNTSFPKTSTTRTLRQRTPFQLPVPNTSLFRSSPLYFASHYFNNLLLHIRSINTLPEFKRKAQQHILPWPKKSLQPRYSWDWSAVRSCDVMRHRLRSATRARDAQCRGLRRCRTEARYHTIALLINLMIISAVTIFLARVVLSYSCPCSRHLN